MNEEHTTQDEQPVRISVVESDDTVPQEPVAQSMHTAPRQPVPIAGVNVSRKPAAVVGIGLVLFLGFFFVEGIGSLTGALTGEVLVNLSEDGIDPTIIEVEHGQEIVWKNDGLIPQNLVSDTLCTAEERCLSTEIIRGGQEYRLLIDESFPAGEYDYYSSVNPEVLGSIIVRLASQEVAPAEVTFTDLLFGSFQEPVEEPAVETSAEPSVLEQELEQVRQLREEQLEPREERPAAPPTNPNGGREYTNPIEEVQALHEGAPLTASVAGKGKGKGQTFQQPESGPALWITGFISLLGMWIAVRRLNKKELCTVE